MQEALGLVPNTTMAIGVSSGVGVAISGRGQVHWDLTDLGRGCWLWLLLSF